MSDNEIAGVGRGPQDRLRYAAKLLALSLTDEMLDSLRVDYGNTNVAVLRHWQAEVADALAALDASREPVCPRHRLGLTCELCDPAASLVSQEAAPREIEQVAREFIDYYTSVVSHALNGCSNCGGKPHTSTCFVGRFERALASSPAPQEQP